MKRYVIIVAGGQGLRMGHELPKQLIPLRGRPVLMHTLERFHAWDASCEQIVVLPESQHSYWKLLCKEIPCSVPHQLVPGGDTRFESVKNGLAVIEGDGLVGVHDGVRPFVSEEVIETCFSQAADYEAVVPVLPVVESLRELGEGFNRPVDRSRFVNVQTPQVFHVDLLKKAYTQPFSFFFTDDASVVESLGHTIALVEGNRNNIKITEPIDLIIAEALLAESKN